MTIERGMTKFDQLIFCLENGHKIIFGLKFGSVEKANSFVLYRKLIETIVRKCL